MLVDRGTNGRNVRLGSLDLESHQDFVRGFRAWTFTEMNEAARTRADAILEDLRVNDAENIPLETFREAFHNDPVIATRMRCSVSSQQLMWRGLQDHFRQHKSRYLGEMNGADNSGPGTLELNPDLDIPDYAAHEIHIQPGGYVGDEFAGQIYHYGTNSFYGGDNDADEIHLALAQQVAAPSNGVVKCAIELGCGVGQLAVAMKERFPGAEAWGLDVGGPLVRYAHARAVRMGVDVHFAQRLAEDTRMEDGSVDLVAALLLFHEVPNVIAKKIAAEMFRIIRPGGVFDVTDFHVGRNDSIPPYRRFLGWVDHKYNEEPWAPGFVSSDFRKVLSDAGFVVEMGPNRFWGLAAYIARKPE